MTERLLAWWCRLRRQLTGDWAEELVSAFECHLFLNLRHRGSELNLPRLRDHAIRFVHGDIRIVTDLDPEALGKPGLIIDCSAEPSVLAGVTSPNYVLQTNLVGTINPRTLAPARCQTDVPLDQQGILCPGTQKDPSSRATNPLLFSAATIGTGH